MPTSPSNDPLASATLAEGATTRPGRPRRFESSEELQLILDAAFEVMGRKGYQNVTVSDILAGADVSTRSFYRHFASKEDLLRALFHRDAERFSAAVTRRVEAAGDPPQALAVWIEEILGFGVGRPRARRAAVLGSPEAMRSLGPGDLRRALDLLIVPLTRVLVAGAAEGSLVSDDPDTDAVLVSALTWETSNRMGEASSRASHDALRRALVSFVARALGTDRRAATGELTGRGGSDGP